MIKHTTVVFIFAFVLLSILSCGEEGLIDPHGDGNLSPPSNEGLQAIDFPTNNGSAWTYIGEFIDPQVGPVQTEFTLRIEGTRDIGGITHRQMTVSEIEIRVLGQPEPIITRQAADHLSLNALYFRIDSDFLDFDLPIFSTYFLKTPQSYTESAFDVFISFIDNPVIHQKHFPPRVIWDFPLWFSEESQLGKEWIVFEKATLPTTRVIRRVIDANVSVTVPVGSYDNAYLVEEEIVGLAQEQALKLSDDLQTLEPASYEPAKYWVVPDVGVVKYQYTYLSERETTTGEVINLLLSEAYELSQFELPGDNSR